MQLGGIRLISNTEINPSLTIQVANNMGLGLQQAGNGLFSIGKYAFLSVTVPIYTVVYVLPKWIFNEGLPKMARLTHQYVIIPICNGIIQVAKFFSEQFIKVAQAIYNHILSPLGGIIKKAAVWTWKAVIIPVITKISQAAIALKDAVVHVAQVIYNHILSPLGSIVKKAAVWTWEAVIIPVANKVFQAAIALKDAVVYVAQAVYNHVLSPLGGIIKKAAAWTWEAVIIPIFNGVAQGYGVIKDLVVPVAQRVYNYALKPLGQLIGQAFRSVIKYTGRAFTAVAVAGNAAVNSTYETYLRLTGRG